jgi:hypothetical protein
MAETKTRQRSVYNNLFKYKQNAGKRSYEISYSIIARNILFLFKFTKNEIGVQMN